MMRSNVHRKQTDSITSSCEYAHTHTPEHKKCTERKGKGGKREGKRENNSIILTEL